MSQPGKTALYVGKCPEGKEEVVHEWPYAHGALIQRRAPLLYLDFVRTKQFHEALCRCHRPSSSRPHALQEKVDPGFPIPFSANLIEVGIVRVTVLL